MKSKKIPMRRCVGCMESKPKKNLVRMTLDGESVSIDHSAKANGRGIYLCRDAECFEKAKKKNAIGRGLNIKLSEHEITKLYEEMFEN